MSSARSRPVLFLNPGGQFGDLLSAARSCRLHQMLAVAGAVEHDVLFPCLPGTGGPVEGEHAPADLAAPRRVPQAVVEGHHVARHRRQRRAAGHIGRVDVEDAGLNGVVELAADFGMVATGDDAEAAMAGGDRIAVEGRLHRGESMHVRRNAVGVGMPRRRTDVQIAVVSAGIEAVFAQQTVDDAEQTFIIEQREEEFGVVLDKRTHNIAFFAVEIGAAPIAAQHALEPLPVALDLVGGEELGEGDKAEGAKLEPLRVCHDRAIEIPCKILTRFVHFWRPL